ncbi:reverse transcriptase domain-containing protein [Tanacetum coccineum]
MPKGAKVLKDLLSHKEKLEKATSSVKLSEECSAIIQRSLPQKEGDPGSFTLPCLIGPLAVKNALADLGASINLMPHSLFRRLGISKLKPTRMSIQLADRSIKYPIGVCENLLVKVSKFIFQVDFIVSEIDEDELVPIILRWPFLATTRAVIDVYEGKLSMRVKIDTVDHDGKWTEVEEEEDSNKVQVVSFYPRAEPVEPLGVKASENRLKLSSIEPPKLELKELPKHLEYAFLQENNQLPVVISSALSTVKKARLLRYFQIPIALEDQEKTTFNCPYGTFAYKRMPFGLCNAPATFQRCMTAIFHELIEDSKEVFMNDFSVFGSSFDHCLKNLEKMLKRCEATNLVLNWEKCHFMVKEGIVLGHKVSKFDIEIHDKKGSKNLAADHLSRVENPDLGKLTKAEIRDLLPKERLMAISDKNNEPCVLTKSCEGVLEPTLDRSLLHVKDGE